jgi:hypothetical protein
MRKVCLTTLFMFVLATPASAQNWANKMFGGKPESPILKDFGTIARGAQLEANLPMTNIWQVPLTITKVHVSCGCVEATPSKMVLQPNESGMLHIKMDGTRFTGQKTVNINVIVGPQFVSSANIIVSANARQDVVLNPGEIDFQTIPRGFPGDRSLEVECAGKPNWKVTEVRKSPAAPFMLKTEVLPQRNNNGAPVVGYRLIATLKPDAPLGPFREPVDMITNDPEQPKVTFIVAGNIQAAVTATPNPVQLPGLKLNAPFTTKFVVSASQPFRITEIQGAYTDVKLVSSDKADKNHFVEVNVTPNVPGLLNREFTLQTDMRNESVKVVVKGNVNP